MGENLTHGSLFAGIGGFELGFEWQGFKTIWAVEKDRHCQLLLKKRFPGILIFDDVKAVGRANLPRVEVISYGFPCQDVSTLGLRAGLERGKRTNLFYEATRIIHELRPAIAVGENVVGLLSADGGQAMHKIICELPKVGHRDLGWRVFDARNFGVVQRRRRVFIVSADSDPNLNLGDRTCFRILHQSGHLPPAPTQPPRKQNPALGGRASLEDASQILIRHSPSGLTAQRWNQMPTLVTDGRYVMLADRKKGTIRYLTPLEWERLQGFPDNWTAGFPKSVRYRMIGNSVVPAVAEYVAKGCKAVLAKDSIALAA